MPEISLFDEIYNLAIQASDAAGSSESREVAFNMLNKISEGQSIDQFDQGRTVAGKLAFEGQINAVNLLFAAFNVSLAAILNGYMDLEERLFTKSGQMTKNQTILARFPKAREGICKLIRMMDSESLNECQQHPYFNRDPGVFYDIYKKMKHYSLNTRIIFHNTIGDLGFKASYQKDIKEVKSNPTNLPAIDRDYMIKLKKYLLEQPPEEIDTKKLTTPPNVPIQPANNTALLKRLSIYTDPPAGQPAELLVSSSLRAMV